jgi:hypothetical protein
MNGGADGRRPLPLPTPNPNQAPHPRISLPSFTIPNNHEHISFDLPGLHANSGDPLINDYIWGWLETTITRPSVLYYPVTWPVWSIWPAVLEQLVSGTVCCGYATSHVPVLCVRLNAVAARLIALLIFTTSYITVRLMAPMTRWTLTAYSVQNSAQFSLRRDIRAP